VEYKNAYLKSMFDHDGFDYEEIYNTYKEAADRLRPYVCDTAKILDDAFQANERVLFEGAQGVMLDIDHGTYPFVTSSDPVSGHVTVGCGVGRPLIEHIVSACTSYTPSVGEGPGRTALFDGDGDPIREVCRGYGSTSGRPRLVGSFASVVGRHSR